MSQMQYFSTNKAKYRSEQIIVSLRNMVLQITIEPCADQLSEVFRVFK